MSDKRIKYKCSFQEDWLSIDDFKPWLRKVGDNILQNVLFVSKLFPSLDKE